MANHDSHIALLVILAVWLPAGAQSVVALSVVVAFMGVGTGSFVPLAGERFSPINPSQGARRLIALSQFLQ
jgi:hypothetical protein